MKKKTKENETSINIKISAVTTEIVTYIYTNFWKTEYFFFQTSQNTFITHPENFEIYYHKIFFRKKQI